jgi:hypothetical protein
MATRINDIADYLKRGRPQTAPLDSAMMTRSLSKGSTPIVKAQDALNTSLGYNIPDAGYYGGGATLPSNPSPPDPFVEPTPIPGANAPMPSPTPSGTIDYGNLYTHMDPNMGYLQPSVEVGGGSSSMPNPTTSMPWDGAYWPPTTTTTEGMSPTTSNIISKIIGGASGAFGGPLAGIAAGYGSKTLLNKLFGPKSVYDPHPTPPGQEPAAADSNTPTSGLLTPGQYAQQTFGGLTPTGYRDPSGSAPFDSHAANQLQMWYQSMGGVPNLAQPDVPSTFQSGVWQLDPESGAFTQVGDRSARDPRWAFPSQGESAQLGLSFANNANKYNDWLRAHNSWFYDQIPGGAGGGGVTGLDPKLFPAGTGGPSLAGDVIQQLDPKLFPIGRGG